MLSLGSGKGARSGPVRLRTPAAVRVVAGLAAVAVALGASACAGDDGGSSSDGEKLTITLEGPNQWNESGSSFGKPWEELVAAFEKAEPTIRVKTVVLPLSKYIE